jgi:hypothetical protein
MKLLLRAGCRSVTVGQSKVGTWVKIASAASHEACATENDVVFVARLFRCFTVESANPNAEFTYGVFNSRSDRTLEIFSNGITASNISLLKVLLLTKMHL